MTMGECAQNDNGGALGVLVPDNTNPYNALVLKGVEAKAQEAGYIVIIANTNSDAEREKEILNSFVSMKLAGILSIPTWLENYCERNVPFILMSRFPYHEPYISRIEHKIRSSFSYIVNDDFLGEYMAAAHLIRQGYRDLYLVLGSTDKSNAEGIMNLTRMDGFKKALSDHSIPYSESHILSGINEEKTGQAGFFSGKKRPSIPGRGFPFAGPRVILVLSQDKERNKMDHELMSRAIAFHGHRCPGLAIGVRAALEAKRILEIGEAEPKGIYCVAEQMACFIDAIQVILGCTAGKGSLIYRPTGKCVFSFFNTNNGKAVRMAKLDNDAGLDKEEAIRFILNQPLEQVFSLGSPTMPAPAYAPRGAAMACALCGERTAESMLRVKDGKPVCLECAGLI